MTDTTESIIEDEEQPMAACNVCGGDYPADEAQEITVLSGGRYRLVECCEACHDAGHYAEIQGNEVVVCEDLAERLYMHSDGVLRDYEEESEEDDDAILYEYGTNVIHEHGWPRRTRKTSLCFGVELELEATTHLNFMQTIEDFGGRDGNGRFLLKRDGSLDDYGMELVTLPYTLDDHRTYFSWDRLLTERLRGMARSGSGTSRCGMHVHVNRSVLTPLTIGKLLVFLNGGSEYDQDDFISEIAQRYSNGYCSRDKAKKITTPFGKNRYKCDRYDILNVGNATIEFRMFRGNLRPERVLKNLEFCHASIRFCEESGIHESASYRNFLRWMKRHRKEYPYLAAFLIEKGRLEPPAGRSTATYATLARKAESALICAPADATYDA